MRIRMLIARILLGKDNHQVIAVALTALSHRKAHPLRNAAHNLRYSLLSNY